MRNKQTKYPILSLLFLVISFSACKKDSNEVSPQRNVYQMNVKSAETWLWANDISYDESIERNKFNILYSTDQTKKRPLVIAIHGGGFGTGSKLDMMPVNLGQALGFAAGTPVLTSSQLTNKGISYATINYRYVDSSNHLDIPLSDCKKFIEFIKANANQYNIDPNQIILMGCSAGASASLWYGLQNPGIKGLILFSPQASLNIRTWKDQVFIPYGAYNQRINDSINKLINNASINFYGVTDADGTYDYASLHNLHYMELMDSNDPELYLAISYWSHYDVLHQPYHLYALRDKAKQVGLPVKIHAMFYEGSLIFANPNMESIIQFCSRKFNL